MHIFLPIAQVSVSIPLMVSVGGVVGLLSGLFGVEGGFLLTPLLRARSRHRRRQAGDGRAPAPLLGAA